MKKIELSQILKSLEKEEQEVLKKISEALLDSNEWHYYNGKRECIKCVRQILVTV
ncbi:MAG: hypothetical protein H6Q69_1688 [Firmicutes bacterium]|nr:hypothetical protein [Bacillota bacterium]